MKTDNLNSYMLWKAVCSSLIYCRPLSERCGRACAARPPRHRASAAACLPCSAAQSHAAPRNPLTARRTRLHTANKLFCIPNLNFWNFYFYFLLFFFIIIFVCGQDYLRFIRSFIWLDYKRTLLVNFSSPL